MPVIWDKPKIVELKDIKGNFGFIDELSSIELGAKGASMARVMLFGPDFIHLHKKTEEGYYHLVGEGEVLLGKKIYTFGQGGARAIIIPPGTLHAARPISKLEKLVFLCVSSPAYDPKDEFRSKRGRNW